VQINHPLFLNNRSHNRKI